MYFQDGCVLTCGAGSYGQLGLEGSQNMFVPHINLELMGSTVTQVACGRLHTLAYVPSSNQIYSFGGNSCGQLGNSTYNQVLVPMVSYVKYFVNRTVSNKSIEHESYNLH
jgi:E3 ubiquitin-protein ligase HERC4